MSIATEISRISGNVSDALTAISNKGVTVPSGSNSDDLADLIGQIQQGGNYQAKTVTPTSSTQVITADQGGTTVLTSLDNVNGTSVVVSGSEMLRWSLTWSEAPVAGKTYHITLSGTRAYRGRTYSYEDDVVWSDFPLTITPTVSPSGSGDENFRLYSGYIDHYASDADSTFYLTFSFEEILPHYDALSQVTVLPASGGGIIITDTTDAAGGTIRTITATEISGTKTITQNGTGIDVASYAAVDVAVPTSGGNLQEKTHITPTESSQTIYPDQGYDGLLDVQIDPISSDYVGSGITRRTYNDMTVNGATVTAPAGYYANSSGKSVASGSATAPASISGTSATVSTGTNTLTLTKTVSVTPSVTAGYVSSGTAGNSSVSLQASVTTKGATTYHPSTSDQTIASGTYTTGAQTIKAVTLSNLSADNIKSGVVVKVGDSTDDDCVTSVTGTYSGGGGSVSTDTKTVTASNYPVSLDFTGMKGQPKMFTVRLNAQVSSSGNTTYYYIVDITSHGTTTHGNCFRVGGTRRVENITSGYSWSYSGTTLTITSSAASRSASPGAFYSGSYELMYVY